MEPPPPINNQIFVDASTSWGIGFVMDGKWLAWKFKDGWRCDGRDIGWGEMVAVELALHSVIEAGFSNVHIILRSDNTGIVGSKRAEMSRNAQQNRILQHILVLFHRHNIWISTKWISTLENPADGPSRGVFPPAQQMFEFAPRIPGHLKQFLYPSITHIDL